MKLASLLELSALNFAASKPKPKADTKPKPPGVHKALHDVLTDARFKFKTLGGNGNARYEKGKEKVFTRAVHHAHLAQQDSGALTRPGDWKHYEADEKVGTFGNGSKKLAKHLGVEKCSCKK